MSVVECLPRGCYHCREKHRPIPCDLPWAMREANSTGYQKIIFYDQLGFSHGMQDWSSMSKSVCYVTVTEKNNSIKSQFMQKKISNNSACFLLLYIQVSAMSIIICVLFWIPAKLIGYSYFHHSVGQREGLSSYVRWWIY